MELLKAMTAAAVLVGIASALSPGSERMHRTVCTALSVLFLAAVVMSAAETDFSALLPQISFDTPSVELPTATLESGVEKGITEDLRRSFSLKEGEVTVEAALSVTAEEITVEHITVVLRGGGILADTMGIVRYVAETYGTECEVRFVGNKTAEGAVRDG